MRRESEKPNKPLKILGERREWEENIKESEREWEWKENERIIRKTQQTPKNLKTITPLPTISNIITRIPTTSNYRPIKISNLKLSKEKLRYSPHNYPANWWHFPLPLPSLLQMACRKHIKLLLNYIGLKIVVVI